MRPLQGTENKELEDLQTEFKKKLNNTSDVKLEPTKDDLVAVEIEGKIVTGKILTK